MGFFKSNRNQTRTIRTMRTERPDTNSDLHYKAKSKLIGAVVLALLGVLILPFIFSNNEPINQPAVTEQAPLVSPSNQPAGGAEGNIAISAAPGVLPNQTAPTEQPSTAQTPNNVAPQPTTIATVNGSTDATGTAIPQSVASSVGNNAVTATEVTSTTAEGGQALTITDTTQQSPDAAVTENKPKAEEPKRKNEDVAKHKSSKQDKNTIRDENRTDDGSVALALLEGKTPSAKSSSKAKDSSTKSGKYSVQLAAYTSMDDARAQRDRLSSSGVSNAFVQTAMVNGRQTYRLRVGPFTSQEAAQAALTRLRGLGHSGFITGN